LNELCAEKRLWNLAQTELKARVCASKFADNVLGNKRRPIESSQLREELGIKKRGTGARRDVENDDQSSMKDRFRRGHKKRAEATGEQANLRDGGTQMEKSVSRGRDEGGKQRWGSSSSYFI